MLTCADLHDCIHSAWLTVSKASLKENLFLVYQVADNVASRAAAFVKKKKKKKKFTFFFFLQK